ncbi:MAG: hypothetical protein CM15mP117_03490 [Alphaproteobacteria bacterium]|nr:MAG: hypothetical protein CM15mP117_03490 [Alphaproteobacteria bacterium]
MQVTDKKQILIFLIVSTLTMSLALAANSQSQPIVILEYPTFTNSTQNYSDNVFIQNHDYSTTHKVKPDETLSHILEDYYSGSGLNLKFIELAIVAHNKHAFVKNNPNFLFADKTLRLPSLNQIQAMILGNNAPVEPTNKGVRSQEIYYIGG